MDTLVRKPLPNNKVPDSQTKPRNFDIIALKCPFCGQEEVVEYDEHYIFCPGCACNYTYLMVIESNCEHIKEGVPTLIHAGKHRIPDRSVPFIFELSGTQLCSICNKICIADGW